MHYAVTIFETLVKPYPRLTSMGVARQTSKKLSTGAYQVHASSEVCIKPPDSRIESCCTKHPTSCNVPHELFSGNEAATQTQISLAVEESVKVRECATSGYYWMFSGTSQYNHTGRRHPFSTVHIPSRNDYALERSSLRERYIRS